MLICVSYIFIFAIASCRRKEKKYSEAEATQLGRFVILIPAYKEDKVINESVSAALKQNYLSHLYDVVVISDQMEAETGDALRKTGAEVLTIHVQESSKAKALNAAAAYLKERSYDYVLILDADNVVPDTYLQDINKTMVGKGYKALQTHRKAKNMNTEIAMLDATIEEMNNNIFRVGHVNMGFSSALIGSGMAFDYNWFLSNVGQIRSTGEDKEFEELLLRQHIRIGYADHIVVWDEKVQQKEAIQHQRRRWIATQFFLASLMWRNLPLAIRERNGDYLLKMVQSTLLPRSILLSALIACTLITSILYFPLSIKWWAIFLLYLFALFIVIPHSMKSKQLATIIKSVPYFMYIMVMNLFHLKGAEKKFIHTKHG